MISALKLAAILAAAICIRSCAAVKMEDFKVGPLASHTTWWLVTDPPSHLLHEPFEIFVQLLRLLAPHLSSDSLNNVEGA